MGKVMQNDTKFLACFFKSESFLGMELYSAKRYIKVVEEGPSHLFFLPLLLLQLPKEKSPQWTTMTPTLTFVEWGMWPKT
jgi:hypothetical protein